MANAITVLTSFLLGRYIIDYYMAYKDREDEIIQLGIGQLETAYKKIPFKLSWTHYQILMRIEDKDERDFYL